MQPRGQLWFALEDICRDFKSFSGLEPKAALEVLIVVLTNMLAEQKAELAKLRPPDGNVAIKKELEQESEKD